MYNCLVKTLSANLDCTFKKSYAVTMWTLITAYKLVEYFVNIHFMLFKKFMLYLMFILWSSCLTFFFISNLFVVRFAVT